MDEKLGKESITEFERVSYNGETSVVLCYPLTGRTHQIRIHLQYLGYPITNDPLYNMPGVWGAGNGKGGKYAYSKEEIELNFLNAHSYEAWIIKQEGAEEEAENDQNTSKADQQDTEKPTAEPQDPPRPDENAVDENTVKRKQESEAPEDIEPKKLKVEEDAPKQPQTNPPKNSAKERPGFDSSLLEIDPDCFECKQTYRDPTRSDLIMYLHAYSYRVSFLRSEPLKTTPTDPLLFFSKFGDLEFKTEYPYWARDDFVE